MTDPLRLFALPGCRVIVVLAAIAALLLTVGGNCSAKDIGTQGVLIIDDSDPGSPINGELRTQIHSTLDAEVPAGYVVHTEFLDSGHFDEPSYDAALHAYIRDKYRKHKIAAIVAVGLRALDISVRLRSELWPDLPIIFVTFDQDRAREPIPPNSTGIVAPKRLQDMVKVARILAPQATRIVLVGTPIQNQPYRRQYLRETSELARHIEFLDLTTLPFGEVASRIAKLPDNAVIISIPLFEDASGHIHNTIEAMRVLAGVANRPIVTDAEYALRAGAAGGVIVSAADLGRDIGKLTARVLNGEHASDIPVTVRDYTEVVFNAQAMRRWDIREDTLPDASKVLFREVTVWQRYRWHILTTLAVVLLQSAIIAGLLVERHRRHAAERSSHQRLLEVAKMDRALTAGAMSSSIAHELNQPLTAIMNNAEAAAMLLDADVLDQEELKAIVADIRRDDGRAGDIIKHLRMLLRQSELKPEELALNEVLADSVALVEGQAKESGVTLQVEIPPETICVRADYVHIQQVILNLALNAIEAMRAMPAGQRSLQVRLSVEQGSKTIVSVSDSGPGIPAEKMATIFHPFVTTKSEGTGLGLSIARTIVETYGGRLWAENKMGAGAVFHFSLNLIPAKQIPAKAA